jgi:hypothetical protein
VEFFFSLILVSVNKALPDAMDYKPVGGLAFALVSVSSASIVY